MDPQVAAPAMQFEVNAGILASALNGLSDSQFAARPAPGFNSIQWVFGHLTHTRCGAAAILGSSIAAPWGEHFGGPTASMKDGAAYPSRAELQRAWDEATAELRAGLARATPALLDTAVAIPVPLPDPRVARVMPFLALHESYHVGQLSLLRKLLGVGPTRLF